MFAFAIVMVAVGLTAAVGFIVANRPRTESRPSGLSRSNQAAAEPVEQEVAMGHEDVVTYLPADIPAILHDILSSVPLATTEEAVMGCYGTMGFAEKPHGAPGENNIHPFQTGSLDELVSRTMTAVGSMENEQHIARFTISTHAKSRTNPHVDLLAHSTEPKRIRLIRYWRTQDSFIANLPE